MCVQMSFCLQLIKLLPTVCCGQRMGFWCEALSLSSRSSKSSWWTGNVCAKVSVICVYLGSCFCPELYILWGLACRFQNMPGPSPGVAMGLGLRPHRVLGRGRVRMRLSTQVSGLPCDQVDISLWVGVSTRVSACAWMALHIFKGVCMSTSQCVQVHGPMGVSCATLSSAFLEPYRARHLGMCVGKEQSAPGCALCWGRA